MCIISKTFEVWPLNEFCCPITPTVEVASNSPRRAALVSLARGGSEGILEGGEGGAVVLWYLKGENALCSNFSIF